MRVEPIGGDWLAAERDEALERTYWRSDLDDSAWLPVAVPSQWASTPGLEATRGPVAYRSRFRTAPLGPDERARVRFGGVFYFGHYWIDDAYLGDAGGYFLPHEMECTRQLRRDAEHVLAVEVECPPQKDRTAKTIVTGVFSHWDAIDPGFNPGGLWRPVELVVTGPAHLTHAVLAPVEVSPTLARLELGVGADYAPAGTGNPEDDDAAAADAPPLPVRLEVEVVPQDGGGESAWAAQNWVLAPGRNEFRLPLTVAEPALWWPRALGPQPMYRLRVRLVGPEGDTWDEHAETTAIRRIDVEDWVFRVNGERFFVRGSNYGPTRMELSRVTAADCERDVRLALDAHLDLLRVHGHVGVPELYDAADRAGLLLWADFPLQWGYSRRVKAAALAQMRGMVRRLGNHPSIALWCAHNEPLAVDVTDVAEMSSWQKVRALASTALPTWNKNVLDPALRKAAEEEDPSRFCNEKSGELPNTLSFGTDTHLYLGWYQSQMRLLPRVAAASPRLVRFMSEFGAQALPDLETLQEMGFPDPGDAWPHVDWSPLTARHCMQAALMERRTDPAASPTLAAYVEATQHYQAELVRYHVETLRKLKYRPTGGFTQFQFQDCFPAVTWSVLDHARRPKAAYEALARACADVVVVAEYPAAAYCPGGALALDLHVVSELRRPLQGVRLTARLGDEEAVWEGDVGADSVCGVGRFEAAAPEKAGVHALVLDLRHPGAPDAVAENRYKVVVAG